MNKNWTPLSALQIGRIAEHLAQAEFMSYGFEVYDTVLDDRGIDFIARKDGRLYEVQVKAVRKYGYTFVAKSKMDICAENRLVCYMNFMVICRQCTSFLPRLGANLTPCWRTRITENKRARPNGALIFQKRTNMCCNHIWQSA